MRFNYMNNIKYYIHIDHHPTSSIINMILSHTWLHCYKLNFIKI